MCVVETVNFGVLVGAAECRSDGMSVLCAGVPLAQTIVDVDRRTRIEVAVESIRVRMPGESRRLRCEMLSAQARMYETLFGSLRAAFRCRYALWHNTASFHTCVRYQ